MARLRNRIVKAEFWTDAELLRWPRDKRETYRGLWAIAEDSGCLEDDPFGWKVSLWPSPVDADITLDLLAQWRDELIEVHKLIPYEADGKRYLYVKNFHQHEHPRNPQAPDLPLPAWVAYRSREIERKDSGRGGTYTINEYVVDVNLIPSTVNHTVALPLAHGSDNTTPVRSSPAQPGPVRSGPVQSGGCGGGGDAPTDRVTATYIEDFHALCPSLPRVRQLTEPRKKRLAKAIDELGAEGLRDFFRRVEASDLLAGRKTDWGADLDWILEPKHVTKILEGSYDNRNGPTKTQANVAKAMALVDQATREEAIREAV